MTVLVELRAQFKTAGKCCVIKWSPDKRVGMLLQGLVAVELNRDGRGKERAADLGTGLREADLGDGGKEEFEHRVAGLPHRLTREFLLELRQGQRHLLCHKGIGWSRRFGEFQYAGRSSATLLEQCTTSLDRVADFPLPGQGQDGK